MKKLAIFGSGSGGNAENICAYFANSSDVEIVFIFTNNKNAFIVKRAEKLNIPIIYTTKGDLTNFKNLDKTLKEYRLGERQYSEESAIMVSIAYKLDDKEIEALASFINGLY